MKHMKHLNRNSSFDQEKDLGKKPTETFFLKIKMESKGIPLAIPWQERKEHSAVRQLSWDWRCS